MNTARKHIVPHTSYMPNSRPVSLTTLNRLATGFEIKRALNGNELTIPLRVSIDMQDTSTHATLRTQYTRIDGADYLPNGRDNFISFIGSEPQFEDGVLSFNCAMVLDPHTKNMERIGCIYTVPSNECADADSPVWSHFLQPFGIVNIPDALMPQGVDYTATLFGQPAVATFDRRTGTITELARFHSPISTGMKVNPLYQDDAVAMIYCYLYHGEMLFFNAFFDLL